jgi:hypothetical protein
MNKANKKAYTRTEGEYEELQRQLEEARELVIDTYQEGWNDNRNNIDCWETHWIDSDSNFADQVTLKNLDPIITHSLK